MNVSIDPIRSTDIPFCEADGCFESPEYCILSRDRDSGTETAYHACSKHVRDMLPTFESAA